MRIGSQMSTTCLHRNEINVPHILAATILSLRRSPADQREYRLFLASQKQGRCSSAAKRVISCLHYLGLQPRRRKSDCLGRSPQVVRVKGLQIPIYVVVRRRCRLPLRSQQIAGRRVRAASATIVTRATHISRRTCKLVDCVAVCPGAWLLRMTRSLLKNDYNSR